MILTESNVINHYLLDQYDKNNILSPATEQDKYLVDKYLGFQSSTQAPFYAQVSSPAPPPIFVGFAWLTFIQSLQMRNKKNFDGVAHFQHLVKRTLRTIDDELRGKEFLVGGKCTLADLAFIPWDLMLDLVLQGDAEAGTASDRKQLFPNWYNWHVKMIQREAVQKMVKLKEEVNAN